MLVIQYCWVELNRNVKTPQIPLRCRCGVPDIENQPLYIKLKMEFILSLNSGNVTFY